MKRGGVQLPTRQAQFLFPRKSNFVSGSKVEVSVRCAVAPDCREWPVGP